MVGAGIIGCAVAWELARRGASVEIVDDRPPGMGATQAAAGMLAPYCEVSHAGTLIDLLGHGLDVYDRFVSGVNAATGHHVPYKRTGKIGRAHV